MREPIGEQTGARAADPIEGSMHSLAHGMTHVASCLRRLNVRRKYYDSLRCNMRSERAVRQRNPAVPSVFV